jgi:hypothetical protein
MAIGRKKGAWLHSMEMTVFMRNRGGNGIGAVKLSAGPIFPSCYENGTDKCFDIAPD